MLERLGPIGFAVLWDSSFIAAKVGLEHLSPLLFVAVRFAACLAVLLAVMLASRRSWNALAGGRWIHSASSGALLHGLGLMGPHLGLLVAPAAHVALAQFAGAALITVLAASLLEVPRADWTVAACSVVAWNTVMVSLGGMGLYFAMLARGTAARTTANFYLVPGLAALFGWLILGENLTFLAMGGLAIASAGCWLVNHGTAGR